MPKECSFYKKTRNCLGEGKGGYNLIKIHSIRKHTSYPMIDIFVCNHCLDELNDYVQSMSDYDLSEEPKKATTYDDLYLDNLLLTMIEMELSRRKETIALYVNGRKYDIRTEA